MTLASKQTARSESGRALAGSILLLLVAMISVQIGASLAKQMFAQVGAEGASALRVAFAGLILLVVWRPWRGALTAGAARAVILYGLALGAMNLLFYLALQRLPLGVTVTFEFIGPLCLAVASSHRRIDLAWVALAGSGIFLLLWLGRSSGPIDLVGALLALAAGGFWALYIVFGQKAGDVLHSGRASALGMIVAALLVIPFGVAHVGAKLFSPGLLPVALGVAVLSSALPYSLEMVAMKRMPTRTFGVLMSLEPAAAALAGLALLGERLGLWQWVGLFCVVAASFGAAATARTGAPVRD